jgi:hypothetical protein
VISVYDESGDVLETHENKGDLKSGEVSGVIWQSRHDSEGDRDFVNSAPL